MNSELVITDESKQYVEEIFGKYNYVDTPLPKNFSGDIVIHMYPSHDKGSSWGYPDAIYTKVVIYDVCSRSAWRLDNNIDNIQVNAPCQTRIFKDLSTALVFESPIDLMVSYDVIYVSESK